jgi:hypothetical protein
MSTPTPTTPATSVLETAVAAATQATKVAAELKSRLDRAPKPADPAKLKAAAERLVDFRWLESTDVEKVAAALADPNTTLDVLAQVAQLAAEKLAQLTGTAGNPRLSAGGPVPTKKASGPDGTGATSGTRAAPESEADRIWNEKMASYRQNLVV